MVVRPLNDKRVSHLAHSSSLDKRAERKTLLADFCFATQNKLEDKCRSRAKNICETVTKVLNRTENSSFVPPELPCSTPL